MDWEDHSRRGCCYHDIKKCIGGNLLPRLGSFDSWVRQSLLLPSPRGPLLVTMAVSTLSPPLHSTRRFGVSVLDSGTMTLLIGAEHPGIGAEILVTSTRGLAIGVRHLAVGGDALGTGNRVLATTVGIGD